MRQVQKMCEEGAHPNIVILDLELTILFARIKNEPIIGRVRDLSRQLQDALDDRRAGLPDNPE